MARKKIKEIIPPDFQFVPVGDMNPAPYNPRVDLKPEDAEYKQIKASIDSFGYLDPIVWNKRTGNIVSGHQRYKILVAMGEKELLARVVDFDDETEKACNLAMNKAVGLWDDIKAELLLQELSQSKFNMDDFGFNHLDDEFFREPEKTAPTQATRFVVCPICGEVFEP